MAKLKGNARLLENVRLVTDNGRGHSVICDLSKDSGGTNAGPSPLELALMALAGCGVIIYADVCKRSKIDPGKIAESTQPPSSISRRYCEMARSETPVGASSASCCVERQRNRPIVRRSGAQSERIVEPSITSRPLPASRELSCRHQVQS